MLFAFGRETEPTMDSEKEKMLAGELYDPADPELAEERRRAREYTRRFNRTDETETEGATVAVGRTVRFDG